MSRVLCPYQMAAQSAVAGLSVVIGSAIAFSWKSTDALDMERQRAMRHSMSGKVRLRTRDTLTIPSYTQIWKRTIRKNGPAAPVRFAFGLGCALALPVLMHALPGRPLTCPYSQIPWLAPHRSIPKAMTS